jgi:hypothetical protein
MRHIVFNVVFLISTCLAYDVIPLSEVSLNRIGLGLDSDQLKTFPNASCGFTWNDEDDSTTKWRPQGIAGITDDKREFIVVSWYGREDQGYSNRGVRISFVDVTNFNAITYRHVLLVDEQYHTFEGMHGGGVMYSGGFIHIPDSRSGTKKVYTFDINSIQYIPEDDRELFYNYVYILPRHSSYDVPITPSFISFDRDRSEAVLGTFYQCGSFHSDSTECMSNGNNRLMWFPPGSVDSHSQYCSPYFSEMQGAVTASNPYSESEHLLWTTSSYGSGHPSHLHVTAVDISQCETDGSSGMNKTFRTIVYPPGLEDIHMSSYDSSLYASFVWLLTEFGSTEGSGNTRTVFATDVKYLLP